MRAIPYNRRNQGFRQQQAWRVLACCEPLDMNTSLIPLSLDQVADHLERMLLRYEELQKSNALLQAQLLEVTQERDALRSRLASARARVDTLLARMPAADAAPAVSHASANVAGAAATGSSSAVVSAAGGNPAAVASKGAQQASIAPTSLLAALTARPAKPEPGAAPSSAWGEENT